ncbi:MAG: LamG domain-containing protein [Sandaracinaceae bacterium]
MIRVCVWRCVPLLLGACSLPLAGISDPPVDAGTGRDAGRRDAGARDAGADAGPRTDAAVPDAGIDAGVPMPDAGPANGCATSDPGLIACFTFEGNTLDGSSNRNDATGSGVSFAAGPVGQSAVLTTTSSLLVLPNGTQDANEVTIEAWVRTDVLAGLPRRSGIVDADGQFSMFLYGDGLVRCAGAGDVYSITPITAGRWHHFACVIASATTRVYVDGAEAAAEPSGALPHVLAGIWLGENGTTGDDQLIGWLDEVRIWSVPRSPAQIMAEFQRGAP